MYVRPLRLFSVQNEIRFCTGKKISNLLLQQNYFSSKACLRRGLVNTKMANI